MQEKQEKNTSMASLGPFEFFSSKQFGTVLMGGVLYVSDSGNNRIQKWGSLSSKGKGQSMSRPKGYTVYRYTTVFVSSS